MKAVVFVGPTLPPRLRPKEDLWDWRPPVRQGELYRAALERPAAIGIIDGYFETVPTVWHKEILWAMAEGIPVFGAASIGALRAAELDSFGMRGVGRVYEDFRDGVLEDDDEVAVLHGPEDLGYPQLTEAMVDIRATLAAAVDGGIATAQTVTELTGVAKALFYKGRNWEAVLRHGAAACRDAALHRFANWLPTGCVHQKWHDAHAMLLTMRSHLRSGAGPMRTTYHLAETLAWQKAVKSLLKGNAAH